MNPNRGRFRCRRSGRRACRVRKRGRIGSRSLKPPSVAAEKAERREAERRHADQEARREAAEAARNAAERRRDAEARRRAAERAAQQRRAAAASPAAAARAGRGAGRRRAARQRGRRRGGGSVAAAAQSAAGNYRGQVIAHLARFKRYPEGARARQAEGVPVVAFTLDGSGRVTGAGLSRSSGHADIDAEALAMVRRAVPFPAPPAGAGRSFSASIGFRLR